MNLPYLPDNDEERRQQVSQSAGEEIKVDSQGKLAMELKSAE
jgi:hypothetical protein